MMKLFISVLFVSSFAQAHDCGALLDNINRESYSSLIKTLSYNGHMVSFTPSLNSNKLMISANGKVLSVVGDSKNFLGIISEDISQLILITREENYLVAQDLLAENPAVAYFNLKSTENIRVGDSFITLAAVRALINGKNEIKHSVAKLGNSTSVETRGSTWGPDDVRPRTTRNNGMGVTISRPPSDMDVQGFPAF